MSESPERTARRRRRFGVLLTLTLVAANLVAFNSILAGWASARLDLTQDHAFSISPATRHLLDGLDDDLTITCYFSKRTHPKLAPLVPRIEDLLEEYRALGHGRVHVEILDPGTSDRIENEANQRYGVTSTPFRLASKYETGIVNAYFAVVVRYGDQYVRYGFDDLIDVEAMPDGDVDVRLRNLEYDITRAIKKVVFGFRSTSELFDRLGKPVHLTAIMTPDRLPAALQKAPEAIRKAAEEFKKSAGGRFSYEEIVPTTPAQQADVAQRFGAQPISMGLFSEGSFYLYLFLSVGDRVEPLELTSSAITEASVHEAIEGSLKRQAPGFLKVVGVVAPGPNLPPDVIRQLQMQGRMMNQPPPEFDQIKTYLKKDYTVENVSLDGTGVPGDVDVLLVLKPQGLSQRAVYNLDQFVMRGGRLILCAGSYQTNFGPSGLGVTPIESGLDDWLKHYGIEISRTLLLDDSNQPLPIPQVRQTVFGPMQTWVLRPYPYLVTVRDAGLQNRAIAGRLDAVGIYWGSPIEVKPPADAKLKTIPILSSSKRSWTDDDASHAGHVDYTVPPGSKPHLIAAAVQGRFDSYFDGKPVPPVPGDSTHHDVTINHSPETRIAVVGDAEFVSDLVARALGRQIGGSFTQNLSFVQNLIDWMNLDNDLIAIRSRSAVTRQLRRLDTKREVAIEVANYLIPLLLLAGFGILRWWRRQRVAPVVSAGAAPERAMSAGVGG